MTYLQEARSANSPRLDAEPPAAAAPVKCKKCRSEIGEGAKKCGVCGALQENVQACRICKELIPFEAGYCNGCKSYQGLFRYVSFSQTTVALMAAVLALLVALAPQVDAFFHRQSDTSFTVTGADATAIYVHVMNSGRKPSIIRECLLAIGPGKAATTVTLDFLNRDTHDAKNVIRPNSEATVGLTATGFTINPDDAAPVTLQMNIEESSGVRERKETFPAKRIHEFIAGKVPAGSL